MPRKPADVTPKQALNLPTLEAWLKSDSNRARLKQILTDPVFLAASRYAEESSRVKVYQLVGDKAKLTEEITRQAAIHAGTVEFTNILKSFLELPRTIGDIEAWHHIQPEQR